MLDELSELFQHYKTAYEKLSLLRQHHQALDNDLFAELIKLEKKFTLENRLYALQLLEESDVLEVKKKQYEKIIQLDAMQVKLERCKNKMNQLIGALKEKNIFSNLEREVSDLLNVMAQQYQNIAVSSDDSALSSQINAVNVQCNTLFKKYEDFKSKTTNLYPSSFFFPKKYNTLTSQHKNVQDQIKEIFTDYASYTFLKGHWGRSHQARARKIAENISSQKNLTEYLQGELGELAVNNQLNSQGSFARRTQYCLNLLKAEQEKLHSQRAEEHGVEVAMVTSSLS